MYIIENYNRLIYYTSLHIMTIVINRELDRINIII